MSAGKSGFVPLASRWSAERVLLVSDVHIRSADELVAEEFLQLLHEAVARGFKHIALLGDIFDYWYGIPSDPGPARRPVLRALSSLAGEIDALLYLEGNHDVFLGPAVEELPGVDLMVAPAEIEVSGNRVFLAHGDRFAEGGPTGFHRTVSRPAFQAVARLTGRRLQDIAGLGLARITRRLGGADDAPWRRAVLERAVEAHELGYDLVVIGHGHSPALLVQDNGCFLRLGDFWQRRCFAVLEDGVVSSCRYHPTGWEVLDSLPISGA